MKARDSRSVAEALDAAHRFFEAGRPEDAATACRGILDSDPRNVDALHLLGAALNRLGDFEGSAATMESAVRARPSDPVLRNNLGNALKEAGRPAEAEKSYREALKRRPNYADAYSNLGGLLQSMGRLPEAEQALRRALALDSGHALAHNHLGMVLGASHKLPEAMESFQRALAIHPRFPEVHRNIATTLLALGRKEDAEKALRAALDLEPRSALGHVRLGNLLRELGRLREAEEECRKAILLDPDLASAYNDLGVVLLDLGRFDEAAQAYREALRRKPTLVSAQSNLGNVSIALGELEAAEQSLRAALGRDPGFTAAHGNLALLLNYLPGRSPEEVFAAHREFASSLRQNPADARHPNSPDPDRLLRIGYLSADFRSHPVAFFVEPVLSAHDRRSYEVTCYYNYPRADTTTQRLMGRADRWRDVFRMADDALAELIRRDEIDVLVDLNGHTADNRLPLLARKPAPVQVTWLGYPNTTGLDTVDYRLTDAMADPEGWTERFHTEQLVRLPRGFLCYRGSQESPAVGPPPVERAGRITFGSFNVAPKISAATIAAWALLLRAVPGARLVLKANAFASAKARSRMTRRLAEQRMDEAQVELLGPTAEYREHLAKYGDIDIALDVFPYNGTTTTCDALWMGVPVVTLAGKVHAARVGASLLHRVGLDELVADTADRYVAIAAALAADRPRLAALRTGLRQRMQGSDLMDAEGFTRQIEEAYRAMWRRWCAGHAL